MIALLKCYLFMAMLIFTWAFIEGTSQRVYGIKEISRFLLFVLVIAVSWPLITLAVILDNLKFWKERWRNCYDSRSSQ